MGHSISTFNPIKVLFLQGNSSTTQHLLQLSILSRFYFYFHNDHKCNRANHLSILSRFYFYRYDIDQVRELLSLSILSRFYFYRTASHESTRAFQLSILSRFYFYSLFLIRKNKAGTTFNPIKVLFLHQITSNAFSATANFQSYQGSIFTQDQVKDRSGNYHAFNPIKVLFLRRRAIIVWVCCTCFQSYQGSIFTGIRHPGSLTKYGLSILSRFYFYQIYKVKLSWFHFLSILSRFYFYQMDSSLQKSDRSSFNPIKVLFLLNTNYRRRKILILSILSRFYFYKNICQIG